jgi:4-hydroxy-tetrahydrodipicolinate synthase
MVCEGEAAYARQIIESDVLSESQRAYADRQLALFKTWYAVWPGRTR